jgi:hypothetical protein
LRANEAQLDVPDTLWRDVLMEEVSCTDSHHTRDARPATSGIYRECRGEQHV